jgi:hypothetical protein
VETELVEIEVAETATKTRHEGPERTQFIDGVKKAERQGGRQRCWA